MTDEHPTSDELLDYALTVQASDHDTVSDTVHNGGNGTDDSAPATDSTTHPTSSEPTADIGSHLNDCLACRVRLTRLRNAPSFEDPADDSLAHLVAVGPTLNADTREFLTRTTRTDPRPGHIWRVGTDDALLVWVRRVVDDSTIDVIPLVFDTEMADSESLLIEAPSTPLAVPLVALTSIRIQLHRDAFITELGPLDIAEPVEALLTMARGGTQRNDLPVGPPITGPDDERIEYRQLVADILGDLTPIVYNDRLQDQDPNEPTPGEAARLRIEASTNRTIDTTQSPDRTGSGSPADAAEAVTIELAGYEVDLSEMFWDLHHDLTLRLGPSLTCERSKVLAQQTDIGSFLALAKIHYIDTSVLVVLFRASQRIDQDQLNPSSAEQATLSSQLPDLAEVPDGVRPLLRDHLDAQAVAIAPGTDLTQAILLTQADLRPALVLPAGTESAAAVTISGHDLVDTLAKFLDGEPTAWELLEQAHTRLPAFEFDTVTRNHATAALNAVRRTGARSPQPAKKESWANLDGTIVDDISAFVEAARNHDIDTALNLLDLDLP